ncbi:hypothetical protein [Streptomyces siamensis]
MLVSALAAAGHPVVGTVSAASLSVAGGLMLAAQRGSAPRPVCGGAVHAREERSLLRGAVVVLMGLNLAIGVFFGAMQVSVTAFVVEHGTPGAAAPIFAGLRRRSEATRHASSGCVASTRARCIGARLAGRTPIQLRSGR